MSNTIAQDQVYIAQYQNFQVALTNAQNALNTVLSTGGVLAVNATFQSRYAPTYAAYLTYMTTLQGYINTFLTAATGLAVPPLNS